MQVELHLFILLSSVFITHGADQDLMSGSEMFTTVNACNETVVKEFDECWENMPQAQYQGVPSNPKKILVTCRVFITGMECISKWSKKCLCKESQKQLLDSIIRALEIYQMLCTDKKFIEEYHQHMGCFNRVSSVWDACNNQFVKNLEKIDNAVPVGEICCARMQYIQCVNGVVRRVCSKRSSSFLSALNLFMTKSTLEAHHPCKCNDIFHNKYRGIQSSSQYVIMDWKIAHFSYYFTGFICYQIL